MIRETRVDAIANQNQRNLPTLAEGASGVTERLSRVNLPIRSVAKQDVHPVCHRAHQFRTTLLSLSSVRSRERLPTLAFSRS
jgi:hypothetical protein